MEVLAGGLAASLSCVFTNPMEVVKNRYFNVFFIVKQTLGGGGE